MQRRLKALGCAVAKGLRAVLLAGLLGGLPGSPGTAAAEQAGGLERALEATLVIRSAGPEASFLGSAFVWGDGAVAVSNAHVVGAAAAVLVVYSDGRREVAPVVALDRGRDLALIGLAGGAGLGLAPVARMPGLGAEVYAFGAPLGAEFSVTRGMVSARPRQTEPAVPLRLLQHDAAVNPGSSGGPLVDADGGLVGMNSQIADGSRYYIGLSYAIGAEDLARLVPQMLHGTLPAMPELGLRLRPVDALLAQALGIAAQGMLIDAVAAGGIADSGGLKPGDVLLSLGGQPIATAGDIAFLVEAALGGQGIAARVLRGGAVLDLHLDLVAPGPVIAQTTATEVPMRNLAYSLARLGVELSDAGRVTLVTDSSPAGFAGLATGDLLLACNGAPVATPAQIAALRQTEITEPAVLLVQRPDGSTLHVVLNPWDRSNRPRAIGGANVLDPAVVPF